MKKIRILKESFILIKNGIKKIEGRLNKGFFKTIYLNDIIYIECLELNEQIKVKIKNILKFNSLKEMFQNIDYKIICPTELNINSSIQRYRKFYSQNQEAKYGILAIFISI